MVTSDLGSQDRAFVTRFNPAYLEELADFYRDNWGSTVTPEQLARGRAEDARHNLVAAGEEFPTYLFVQRNRMLGHLTTIPVRLRAGGVERPAYWFIGFMVRPEHRNGPIGFGLLKRAVAELELTLSLTVQQTTVRLLTAVGFRHIGVLPNYARLIRPDRVLAQIDLDALGITGLPGPLRRMVRLMRFRAASVVAGLAARTALAAWTTINGSPGRGFVGCNSIALPDTRLDALWYDCRDVVGCVGVRDAAYLSWRYGTSSTGDYRTVMVSEGNVLRGIAIVRVPRVEGDPRLGGIRVATLSDLLYDPARTRVGLALVAEAERVAGLLDADVLLVSASHRAHAPLLRRRGFVRFGGNLHLLVRDATGALPGATTLDEWWVLRGDMKADNVF